jgi:hypothetical protein
MAPPAPAADLAGIAKRIVVIHGQRVLFDFDLANLYGVTIKRLNQQVRRNRERFPPDFAFELPSGEVANLRMQIASSSWGGRRAAYFAFTEHGAMTVKLGSMLFVGFGLTIAALRLWT